MLGIVAGLAAGLFVLVTTVVGVRMVLLARRTRGVPEILIGAGMTVIGLLGYPLGLAAGTGRGTVAEMSLPLWGLSIVAIDLGLVLIYAFTWRVFRPSAAWARALVAVSGVYLGAVGLGQLRSFLQAAPETPSGEVALAWTGAFLVGSAGCFLWSGVEGALQYRMARRRLAMGLADPVVANRFGLWAAFGASATLICLASAVGLLRGVYSGASDEMKIVTGVFGAIGSGAMYLAFAPPAWYLRRVRGRTRAAA